MSNYYYSKTTRGFYPPDFRGVMPGDVTQITEAEWRALLDGAAAEGKEIVPDAGGRPVLGEPPPPSVPTVVSSTQAKIALANAGLFDEIDDFMAALPKADPRRIAWTTAAEFTRDSPTLAAVAQQLSLSDAQVDALFSAADAITV